MTHPLKVESSSNSKKLSKPIKLTVSAPYLSNSNVEINFGNLRENLKIAGFVQASRNRPRNSSITLGGLGDTTQRIKDITGTKLGAGAQGEVFTHKQNINKVVKRTAAIINSKTGFIYPKFGPSLNSKKISKNYVQNLGKLKQIMSNNTSNLMNTYPSLFLEALLQSKLADAGISPIVHEVVATEVKQNGQINSKVVVYIVMDKAFTPSMTPNYYNKIRKEMKKKALQSGVMYQNGNKSWFPKQEHIMFDKHGTPLLINLGSSGYLTTIEQMQAIKKKYGTEIKGNKNAGITIERFERLG